MAKKKAVTVQKASNTTPHMGGFTLPLTFLTASNIAPEWEAGDRDTFLRTFWKRFGNDMLQGVIATAVAKVQTQNWQLEGPKRLVQMYHRFLRDEADFFRGYDSLVSRGLQDYYTQDNGWFIERFRANKRDKSGPALGFAHMDSQRVKATGNVDYPWYYEDVGGEYHLMHRSQVIRIVDLPTPSTEMWSDERGFCALSRTLSTAMILTMIVAMKREKLADLPPSALAIFNNISRKQFENSLRLHGAEDDMADNMLYRQLLPLFGIDPAHPASVQFLSLREVWEGFSDEEAMNMAAYSFAAGFRMDPREFWPVSQGTLGTGKEAEVQHQKAKGKGHGLIFTSLERGFNANDSLPKNVKFKFAIQDADEEEQRAKIHSMQIGNIEGMQKAGAGLVPAEVRYLLVKKYKVIPQELLVPPEEGKEPELIIADVYMDDVERQAKEYGGWFFGPVVTMDYDGTIWRKAAWDSARKELPDGPLFIGNKGGPGSGNWGHGGRPGLRGGSGGSGRAVGAAVVSLVNEYRIQPGEDFYDYTGRLIKLGTEGKLQFEELIHYTEDAKRDEPISAEKKPERDVVTVEVAADALGYDQYVLNAHEVLTSIEQDWLQQADPEAKVAITEAFQATPELKEIRLFMMHDASESDLPFDEWKSTPMDVWRGGQPVFGDTFATFTLSKGAAEGFARNREGTVYKANVKPSDLVGFAPTGATEAYVPRYDANGNPVVFAEEYEVSAKELTLQTLTKEFPCCDSHAAQEFPDLIDNLKELGYLSTEEAYASELMPADVVAAIATGLKQAGKQGDDLLMAFVRQFRHKLGLRTYALNEKAHAGLQTIDKKIAVLPRAQAAQVRKASAGLFASLDNKEGNARIKNIPQDVWDEAEKLDLEESKPEVGEKGGSGSGNFGHTGRPGLRGGSGGKLTGAVKVINALPEHTGDYTLEDDPITTPLTYDPNGNGIIVGASDEPVETVNVPIDKLVATTPATNRGITMKYAKEGSLDSVRAVLRDGKYYLMDGHHRASAAHYVGDDTISVNVHKFVGRRQ